MATNVTTKVLESTKVLGLTDEYFEYYTKYKNEYGENICILMQIGSFYEMQMVKNEKENIGNLNNVASLLNIQITKKNKSIEKVDRSNPYMAGFPKPALSKFLPILLENGYTVVVIDQQDTNSKGKIKRSISGIYSPSIQPLDFQNSNEESGLSSQICSGDNILTSVFIELFLTKNNKVSGIYSFININISTNKFEIYENCIENDDIESLYDDIFRIFLRYKSKEILITFKNDNNANEISQQNSKFSKEFICNYFDLDEKIVTVKNNLSEDLQTKFKNYNNINYANEFLRKIYTHIEFGLLEPIEFFNLEKHQLSICNILFILDFIGKHDIKYLDNICIPEIINEHNFLLLEMNTLNQLNLLPKRGSTIKNGSLFQVIDKTSTAVGRRGLKELICKPLISCEEIEERYKLSEIIMKNCDLKIIDKHLNEICDFEKYHRKMILEVLHPYELYNLHLTYVQINKLLIYIQKKLKQEEFAKLLNQKTLEEYINSYSKIFNLNELQKSSLNDSNSYSCCNFFNVNVVQELDKISNDINELTSKSFEIVKKKLETICKEINVENWLKLTYTDQDGYHFTCTKIRGNLLQKSLKSSNDGIVIKTNTNQCKITSDEIRGLSLKLLNLKDIFNKKIKLHYIESIKNLAKNYGYIFNDMKIFIEKLDIIKSNIQCKELYNYSKPEIITGTESFFEVKDLRHAIIERINDNTEYIPNDVSLSLDKKGMILYALNSCGKSSLLRSIGLCVVMAQCGLYVPCSKLKLCPFETIITQVDLYDNLWKAQSSFISEMIGLRKILKTANDKCLVLSDELTKGTEVISATSIFTSAVLELVKRNCKFMFTTHLQDVAKLDIIKSCKSIEICHLSVIIEESGNGKDACILFERKLKPGPCSELYGLEVAKAIGLGKEFIDIAFEIRNDLINKKNGILDTKKSKYNKSKIIDSCEICNYKPNKKTDIPLDVHHIKFQCTADNNDFIGHFHKNSKFNLVTLCKECHQKVHKDIINIQGYIQTSNGVKLIYK